jgi:hypothetical protein
MIDLIGELVAEAIDARTSELASANDVEGGWFLRGVADALSGRGLDPAAVSSGNAYGAQYRAGYNGVNEARERVGV